MPFPVELLRFFGDMTGTESTAAQPPAEITNDKFDNLNRTGLGLVKQANTD